MDILKQNLEVAQGFTPLSGTEMQALRDRARRYAADGRFEPYKVSLQFDNPEARMAHDFPIDMQQIETRELVAETQNTGWPFPS
jgi:hypothetical protein